MDGMRMFAATQRPPLSDIKTFSPDQEVLTYLLWSPPHKPEVLTFASLFFTRILAKPAIFHDLEFVFPIQMIAETSRQFPDPINQCNVGFHRQQEVVLPGALILPLIIV